MRLGIVSDEFFEPSLGAMGGFGWAAAQVARLFAASPQLGVEVVFLAADELATNGAALTVHGTPLVPWEPSLEEHQRRLDAERVDLLLAIDYRRGYRRVFDAFPDAPVVVWVRDPRVIADRLAVMGLRMPGGRWRVPPSGARSRPTRSLGSLVWERRRRSQPVLFAATAPYLAEKLQGAYAVRTSDVAHLPNPLHAGDAGRAPAADDAPPLVLFLGRLNPVKRPWVFVELARAFPAAEFVVAGGFYDRRGTPDWMATAPPNLSWVGHVDGEAKQRLLSRAAVLVNTSIHEGLAVSLLEALASETALLGCQDPDGLVSRFGVYVGRHPGDGLGALPALTAGLARLLDDPVRRRELARDGRAWVEAHHSRDAFLCAFGELCARAGLAPEWSTFV